MKRNHRLFMVVSLILLLATSARPSELGIAGDRFTLDGEETFLLGISYYGACSAPAGFIRRDLDDFKKFGCNWIRVWATWNVFGNDVSVVDRQGKPREVFLTKLKAIIGEADRRGIVVDVTLSRGVDLPDQSAHLHAVRVLARALRPYRNVYFDLANERNIRDARYVSFQELRELAIAVRQMDPTRLITASHAGDLDRGDLQQYMQTVRVDFVTPHRPRHAGSAAETRAKTRQLLAWSKSAGRPLPVHYQEPFRRGFGRWQPVAKDFLADLRAAATAGAGGWCLHNGAVQKKKRPRRCFDLRQKEGRLLEQLDKEERKVLARMAASAKRRVAQAETER